MEKQYGTFIKVDDYPKGAKELAKKRVRGLMHFNIVQTQPLSVLLESAYLQGLVDAIESLPQSEDKPHD